MKCLIKNCDSDIYAASLCSVHYNRWRTKGTLEPSKYSRAPVEVRFWRQVDKKSDDECWEWKGAIRTTGYGQLNLGGRGSKQVTTHRYSWELHNGKIPESSEYHGTVVMHTCDNRKCVNPAHLKLGTQKDNVKDMNVKGRRVDAQLKGERHVNAKFTDDEVRQIRKSPLNNAELGRVYGVPRQTIRYIRVGGWKHIED